MTHTLMRTSIGAAAVAALALGAISCAESAIEISNRPSAPKIYSGCEILAAKWQKEFAAGHLTAPLYHRLKAYLHLERGLAALTAGRRGEALYFWARSWLERPRMTWHASPGSQQVEPAQRAIPRD